MDLKALITELETLRKQAGDIVTEHKGGEIPAEKKAELDKMLGRASEVMGLVEAAQAEDRQGRDLKNLADFLEKPQYRIPRGVADGNDDDGRKALAAAGWEVKNGMVYAPHSLLGSSVRLANGEFKQLGPVEMYPEEVLFGPMPDGKDQAASEFFRLTRVSFQPLYRKAYLKYMAGSRARTESMAFAMLAPDEQKALSEGIDTAGGYVVPPDVQAEILTRLPMTAVMRANCRVVPTSRDRVSFPRLQPNASSGSVYTSGFVGSWAGETPAFSDTDPALGLFEIAVKKIRVATKVSNDLLADAVVNFLGMLAQDGAVNMALVEDQGFISGDGSPLQPVGLQNSGLTTVDVEGSTTDTISNTSSNQGSAPKIIDMHYQLPQQYQLQAKWLWHRLTEGKVRKLVDGQNRYLWGGWSEQGFVAQMGEFQGKPLMRSDFVAQDGTNANKVMYYGDFSAYIIAQRAQITSTVLRERFADTDQTGIILWERVGGGLWNTDAIRAGIV